MKRLGAALVALAALGSLAACGEDFPVEEGSGALEVKVGEEFSWNGFHVEDGWTLEGIQRTVNMQEVTTPEVTGTIVNESEDERTALFQIAFSADGDPIATVNCSAGKMVTDQAMQFVCPGLNTTMPADYDAVTVQAFPDRDSTSG